MGLGWSRVGEFSLLDFSLRYWRDQYILDLGCGLDTYVYGIACIAQARGYIPVDRHHMPTWIQKFVQGTQWNSALVHSEAYARVKFERIPVYPVLGDMVGVLERLPTHSCGILIAGVDRMIISESERTFDGRIAIQVLSSEIQRVLSPDSVCISYASFLSLPTLSVAEKYGDYLTLFQKKV